MCRPISYIYVNNFNNPEYYGLYYLTTDILNDKILADFYDHSGGHLDDLQGHGAITYIVGLPVTQGWHVEYNLPYAYIGDYPTEILQTLKAGKFRYVFTSEYLLTKAAWDKFYDNWLSIRREMEVSYFTGNSNTKEQDKCYAISLYKKEHDLFWDMFAVKKNRRRRWR